MTVMKVEKKDLSFLLDSLSSVIDFNKDLPMNVFVGGGFLFWFFERPLLCYFETFASLISNSVSSFKSDVFVKFSGGEALANSCFSVDGTNLEKDINWLSKSSENFFDGSVGYPVILCDSSCNWVAFESAYEEFGVVAVKKSGLKGGFYEYLNSNFISMDELAELASGPSAEGKVAKALISSYRS
ncbi:hypothetical protein [Pseudomonas sp. R11-23-07]|uniref:hypothetical protein n=1 Tax=Pseudomonas sp. R11-23-07 TaxID=658632 RepID=UPI000F58CBDC|nr:hypothetical protein [Pseudomonas sp. R11-23-07]AZF56248.1 hypothetical protein C4J84_0340 [Pseudomonas sp. R11-23-07]